MCSLVNLMQNKNIDFKRIQEAIVLFAVACLTISYFGGYYLLITTIGHHSRLLRQIAVALLFCKLVTTRYSKREFGWVALLLVLALTNYQYSGNTRAIYNALMICSLKDVDLKKVLKVSFYSIVFIIALLGMLAAFGITGIVSVTENFGRGDMSSDFSAVETRFYMGYIHPNTWAHAMFSAMLLGAAAFWEKLDWKGILVLALVNYLVYELAASRTSFICGCLLCLLVLLAKYISRLWELWITKTGIVAGAVAAWAIVFTARVDFEDNLRWELIDWKLFTGRIVQAKAYLESCGLSMFGKSVPDQLDNGYILDMGYMRMLLENGIIVYVLMFVVTIAILIYALKHRRNDIVVVVLCISLYGIYENLAISQIPANLVLYFAAIGLFGRRGKATLLASAGDSC